MLARSGYRSEFVYGGESHFDNMRGFFTGNGFQKVVDRRDMKPVFEGSWGASDEDLFDKSLERLKTLHAANKPFFTLIFSSSNHEPFEFPDGKIALHEQPKQTVNNAVKYADFALGKFIRAAKQQDYWRDTVFLIVADHDNRVYGDSLVPVHKFHIPGLILGADIEPKRIKPFASQIDLGPTLLSLRARLSPGRERPVREPALRSRRLGEGAQDRRVDLLVDARDAGEDRGLHGR